MKRHLPEEILQLRVQVPDERATSYDLSMAVVEGQASVAHVFPVDALCSRGHADDLSLLHICTWMEQITYYLYLYWLVWIFIL